MTSGGTTWWGFEWWDVFPWSICRTGAGLQHDSIQKGKHGAYVAWCPNHPGIILTSSDILQDFFFGKPCSLLSGSEMFWSFAVEHSFCWRLLLQNARREADEVFRSILNAWHVQTNLQYLQYFAVLLLISGFNYWNLPRICNGLSFVNPTLCNWCLCNLRNTMITMHLLPRAVQEQSELPEACQRSVAEHRLQPHSQPKRLVSANLNQHGYITTIHSCHISVPGSWG